ncbi:fibrillin-1-like isoform X2 [Pygocentrus nattereri]|uniref:fibrillin-1-like isoform X2 n=1 Tax=Pygocentrus nattereri TaxID=42514 RepID=UPI00189114EF|nr:fibrillin-1-like isoform X2 [Pygocentrus nattereri]
MASKYTLIFTAFVLVSCVVETQGFFEAPSYPAKVKYEDEQGKLNHFRDKRDTSTAAQEYIVVVEVNVSEVILIQLLKSSLDLFSLQIDNITTISTVEISTVCHSNDTGYQCKCEDQYFWPCDMCTAYGPCDDIINATCGCISGIPSDGQFCQPISELMNATCPTPTAPPTGGPPSEYIVDIDISVSDNLMIPDLKKMLMNFSVPVTLDSGVNITEMTITTVCTSDGPEYVCRCEEQYAWSYNTCRTYGACDDSMDGTCGCIRALPVEELCQRDVDECLSSPSLCGPNAICTNAIGGYSCSCRTGFTAADSNQSVSINNSCTGGPPSEYIVDVDISVSDNLMALELKKLLMNFSVPVTLDSGVNITEMTITTVCTSDGPEYVCRCEEQYAWSYNTCRTYGACDDSMDGTCGCIRALPVEELCQRDVDECLSSPSLCGPNAICTNAIGGYSCSCRTGFTAADSNQSVSINNSCTGGPPSEYIVDVDISVSDNLMVLELKKLLMNFSVPVTLDSGVNITEMTITTVCTSDGPEYVCRCEEQYAWSYNTCRTYGACDDSMDGTCGCIRALPAEELCQRDVNECLSETSVCGPNSTCVNTVGGYSCFCLVGFTATNSNQSVSINNTCADVDECLFTPSQCGPNSTCTNTVGGYSCSCWGGFTVINANLSISVSNPCIDIDECLFAPSVCGLNSMCNNTVGGYSCSCWTGFTAVNSSLGVSVNNSCVDVEECLSEPSICGPNSTCINTVGGYSCSCWSGFNITNSSLSISVNNSCNDVDECLLTPSVCGPNSTCFNTVGGYNCFCWNGFTATNSSLRVNISNPCRDVDECLSAPSVCGSNSSCINTAGGYSCSCWTGFAATNSNLTISIINPCIDIDECVPESSVCGPNSTCTNTVGGYNCSCLKGFTRTNSSLMISVNNTCRDVDECLLGTSVCGPNSTCTNTLWGYNCSCWTGFTASSSSLTINARNPCIDVDECLSTPSVCGPNSTCTNTAGGYSCFCWHGFTATNSNLTVSIINPCIDVDECLSAPSVCGSNSTCINTVGGYSCSCWSGFTATNSSLDTNASNPCIDVDECLSALSVCGPNSNCNNTVRGYSCSCWAGFTVTNSNQKINTSNPCIDVDECLFTPSPCGPNSNCNNTVGGYSCSCWGGFAVTNANLNVSISNPCIDIDECLFAPSVCGLNSMCNNTVGGYSCSCWTGFTAVNSSLGVSVNNSCVDVEECLSEPSICGPNSTCINTVGGYSCSCRSGFNITNSSLSIGVHNSCNDVDECLLTPSVCGPNSTCINTVGGYNCFCWNGFTATNSSLRVNISNPCKDVDECLSAPSVCGSNSSCINTAGGYSCSCWTGFAATNSNLTISIINPCIDINECAPEPSICGPNSTCTNMIGGYNCYCMGGFTPTYSRLAVNITNPCRDADECLSTPSVCGPNSTCTNIIGGYSCSCWPGFTATNSNLKINASNPCRDIDECAPESSVCGPNSICTNMIGGYKCSCTGGFTPTYSSLMISVNNTCRDVDECLLGTVCGPNSTCTNKVGGYSCSCWVGFTATSSNLPVSVSNPCTDIDECLSSPPVCGLNSACSNTIGGYSCSCLNGFTATNSKLPVNSSNPCRDVDECLSPSLACGLNSTCSNTIGGYSCSCLSGFTATNSKLPINASNPCIDVDECLSSPPVCGLNSACSNTIGGYSCSCLNGFTATNSRLPVNSSNPCRDVDECLSTLSVCGPNSTCINTVGGYSCSCWLGFTATNSNLKINASNPCRDVDECLVAPSVCVSNSTCTNTLGSYSCSCLPGFTVSNSSLTASISNPCKDVNECLVTPSYCGPNSTCTNTIGGYSCSCLSGFTVTNSSLNVSTSNPCRAPSTVAPTLPPTVSSENSISMSLTINEKFDITLTDPSSAKYMRYKAQIEQAIDASYKNVAGYKSGSVRVSRFRSGSVIADFTIATTTDTLDFGSANTQLSSALVDKGFSVNENAFAESKESVLVQNQGKIYPLQEMQLNCDPPSGAVGDIKWSVNGADPLLNPDKYSVVNNNHTLKVKRVTTDYTGVYECITQKNSIHNIQWQRIQIQPFPNIQAGSDKVFKCETLTVPLKCCAQSSYTIQWTRDSQTGTLMPPGSGCITYNYIIQKQDCQAGDANATFTCQLSDVSLSNLSYSSERIMIRATNSNFFCSESSMYGVGNKNDIRSKSCDGGKVGIQQAKCNSTGRWEEIFNNCTLRVIQDLTDEVKQLEVAQIPQFTANLSEAAEKHSVNITGAPVTLVKVVDLLSTIATISKSVTVSKDVMMDFLRTVDVISSVGTQSAWKSLNNDSDSWRTSSVLLQSIENIGNSLSDEQFSITTSSIQLNRTIFNNTFQGTFGQNLSTLIDIPKTNGSNSITTIVFSALDNVLPVRNSTHNGSSLTDTSINADVVMIKLAQAIDPLISLTFDVSNASLGNPQCVFWNFSLLDGIGGWDSTGCEVKKSGVGSDSVVCQCTHTTSFSVLMSPFFSADTGLKHITYIGVGISVGCLVLCLIIEIVVWKSMTRNDTSYMRHFSTINLAASLLIADICFLIQAGIVKDGELTPVGPCTALTFFIHLFYLALFFWMLLSALLLLYRTLVVFSKFSRSVMMVIGFAVGYGVPLIIAVITVAVTAGNNGYVQEKNVCWLNWDKTKALLAFVVPALTIVLINILVLVVVLYTMLRRGVGATTYHSEDKHTLLVIARCVGILTPLFGLTWGFGIGTMVSSAFGIHIVFALLNSLQGFFILVFGTLLDSKIRAALMGKLKLKNISSNLSGSTSAGPSSSTGKGYTHRFPRRYAYNISAAAYSSSVPSSNSDTFKFIDT